MLTPQAKLAALGGLTYAFARFKFGKDNSTALTYGLAAITLWSLLTAHNEQPKAS